VELEGLNEGNDRKKIFYAKLGYSHEKLGNDEEAYQAFCNTFSFGADYDSYYSSKANEIHERIKAKEQAALLAEIGITEENTDTQEAQSEESTSVKSKVSKWFRRKK
jgi:hypothetical protein